MLSFQYCSYRRDKFDRDTIEHGLAKYMKKSAGNMHKFDQNRERELKSCHVMIRYFGTITALPKRVKSWPKRRLVEK